MLADIRHADCITAHEAADLADECARLDGIAFLAIAERMLCLELERMLEPRSELRGKVILARIELVAQERQRPAEVAEHAVVGLDVLVDLSAVNLEVDDLRVRRELIDLARHTVAEAHADAEQKVAFLNGHVGTVRAVHARKA